MPNLLETLTEGAALGLAVTGTTLVAVAIAGQLERGDPFDPINAVSHVVLGDKVIGRGGFRPTETTIAIATHGAAMISWGVLHEAAFGKAPAPASFALGLLTAGIAAVTDFVIVPKRLTPGIEHRLSPAAMLATYAVLGLTLGLSGKKR